MAFYLILVTYYMAADDLIGSKKPLEPDVCMCQAKPFSLQLTTYLVKYNHFDIELCADCAFRGKVDFEWSSSINKSCSQASIAHFFGYDTTTYWAAYVLAPFAPVIFYWMFVRLTDPERHGRY